MTTSSEVTERTLQRLQTLFTQAEDFRRHGEEGSAEAALALAANIITRYQLDQATIDAARSSSDAEAIVRVALTFTGIYGETQRLNAYRYAAALASVEPIMATGWTERGKLDMLLVGHDSDVQAAQLLLASLQTQCLTALERWARKHRTHIAGLTAMQKFKERRQFMVEFGYAAAERLARAQRAAHDAHRSDHPGSELALQTRSDLVTRWIEEHLNVTMGRSTSRAPGTELAGSAGRSAGRQATTGEARVGPTRRSITA